MEFRAKDLLITVLPQAELAEQAKACILHTRICLYPTYCRWPSFDCGPCSWRPTFDCGGCSWLPTRGCDFLASCGPGRSACDATIICPAGSIDPWLIRSKDDLVALRNELQETLKQLGEIEKAGLPTQVRSREEAETLERGLTEALEQVRKLKGELK